MILLYSGRGSNSKQRRKLLGTMRHRSSMKTSALPWSMASLQLLGGDWVSTGWLCSSPTLATSRCSHRSRPCLWTFQTHAFLKYQNFYCSDGSGHLHCAARQYYILYCPTDSILPPWSASHRWVEIAGWTVYWRLSASTVSTTTLTESLIRSPRTTLIYTT